MKRTMVESISKRLIRDIANTISLNYINITINNKMAVPFNI